MLHLYLWRACDYGLGRAWLKKRYLRPQLLQWFRETLTSLFKNVSVKKALVRHTLHRWCLRKHVASPNQRTRAGWWPRVCSWRVEPEAVLVTGLQPERQGPPPPPFPPHRADHHPAVVPSMGTHAAALWSHGSCPSSAAHLWLWFLPKDIAAYLLAA